jgi:hypothetical protein
MQILFELLCFGVMHALKTVPTGSVDVNSDEICVMCLIQLRNNLPVCENASSKSVCSRQQENTEKTHTICIKDR